MNRLYVPDAPGTTPTGGGYTSPETGGGGSGTSPTGGGYGVSPVEGTVYVPPWSPFSGSTVGTSPTLTRPTGGTVRVYDPGATSGVSVRTGGTIRLTGPGMGSTVLLNPTTLAAGGVAYAPGNALLVSAPAAFDDEDLPSGPEIVVSGIKSLIQQIDDVLEGGEVSGGTVSKLIKWFDYGKTFWNAVTLSSQEAREIIRDFVHVLMLAAQCQREQAEVELMNWVSKLSNLGIIPDAAMVSLATQVHYNVELIKARYAGLSQAELDKVVSDLRNLARALTSQGPITSSSPPPSPTQTATDAANTAYEAWQGARRRWQKFVNDHGITAGYPYPNTTLNELWQILAQSELNAFFAWRKAQARALAWEMFPDDQVERDAWVVKRDAEIDKDKGAERAARAAGGGMVPKTGRK